MRTKTDTQRYNLHRRAKKDGIRVDSKSRTIFLAYGTGMLTKATERLFREFRYAIQYEIV